MAIFNLSEHADKEDLSLNIFKTASLFETIEKSCDAGFHRPALRYFGKDISYGDLFENIDNCKRALMSFGIMKGDVIACALPTIPEAIYIFYAANKIGAIVQWIDVRITNEELANALKKTNARLLFIMAFNIKRTPTLEDIPCEQVIILRGCDTFPNSVQFWFKFGEFFNGRWREAKKKNYIDYSSFIGNRACLNENPHKLAPSSSEEVAVIFPTSGTTGTPKYVQLTNGAINFSIENGLLNDPAVGDVWMASIPIFVATGLIWNVHYPLSRGMTVHVIPYMEPEKFPAFMRRIKLNHLCSIPSYWKFVLDDKVGQDTEDYSYLKSVIVAGESLGVAFEKKINAFLKGHGVVHSLITAYGMTETACSGTVKIEGTGFYSEGSVGIPIRHISIKIVNEKDEEVPRNQPGEICIKTPHCTPGYVGDEEETSNLIRRHSDGEMWIHSGDMGYLSESGELFLVGRKKRMLVHVSGSKIFAEEIERVVKSHPCVLECAVIGTDIFDRCVGGIVAYVIPQNKAVSKRDIIKICREKLPSHCVPSEIKFVEKLPRIGMGKINYKMLEDGAV